MDWYVAVLKKYTVFQGRARRQEYWMFFLVNIIISIVIGIIDGLISDSTFLGLIYSLAVFLPSLAVAVRRLHDTDRSGWWVLIGLIPIIGFIVLLVFFAQEGNSEPNRFGSNPKLAV